MAENFDFHSHRERKSLKMRDDICSIPVSEVFKHREGCPVCRMRDEAENRLLEYIMGAAMMEPDVRVATNKEGFCYNHYKMMLKRRNRLSIALMLDSRLDEINKNVFGNGKLFHSAGGVKAEKTEKICSTCFVCERVEKAMSSLINTVIRLYDGELEFRKLFSEQTQLCLPHYSLLISESGKKMSRRFKGEFKAEATRIASMNIEELKSDVRHFCDMYDYRNNGEDADWGNSRDSIERSIAWLCSFDPEKQ